MDSTENNEKVIVRYSSYTPAQKKATKKYRENNKDKVNEQRKKYYQIRKEKDPQFLEYKRTKAKEYYMKKKLISSIQIAPSPIESDVIISNNPPEEIIDIKKPDTNGLEVILSCDTETEADFVKPEEAQSHTEGELSSKCHDEPKAEPVKKSRKPKKVVSEEKTPVLEKKQEEPKAKVSKKKSSPK